jgi:hypothetical protein
MASVGPPYQTLAAASQAFVQTIQPSDGATVGTIERAVGNIEMACLNLGQSIKEPTE